MVRVEESFGHERKMPGAYSSGLWPQNYTNCLFLAFWTYVCTTYVWIVELREGNYLIHNEAETFMNSHSLL